MTVPIVAGGPYATSEYPTILKSKKVDLAVLGEGEYVFSELLERMLENDFKIPSGEVLREINGIAFADRENGRESACEVIRFDRLPFIKEEKALWGGEAKGSTVLETVKGGGDSLAYILYTSGSTGKPKGVMIEHRQVINCISWMQETFKLERNHQVVQRTPLTFDPSVWEVFWPLAFGAATHVLPDGPRKDASQLIELLIGNKELTVMYCTASLVTAMTAFLKANRPMDKLRLPYFLTGAEPIAMDTVKSLYRFLDGQFVNTYGPTEGTINNTWYPFPRDDKRTVVPIGLPVSNNRIYILADDGVNACRRSGRDLHWRRQFGAGLFE